MCGNITSDDSPGRDHGIGADPHAGEDHAARPESGTVLDTRLHQPPLPVAIAIGDCGQRHSRTSRKHVVRKADARTDEDIITNLDPVPHHRLVFDCDSVANARTGFDEGVVTNIAIAADHGTPHYVRVGPYSRTRTNLLAFAERMGMNKDVRCQWKGPYEAAERTGTATLSHPILSAAASIMRTTRHPLTPSARGFFPERMHSKKSSTSASSGSID